MEINKTGSIYNTSENKVDLKISKELSVNPIKANSLEKDNISFKTNNAISSNPFDDTKKAIRKANFNWYDADKDNKVTLPELLLGGDPTDPKNTGTVKEFKETDKNHDNVVSPEEAMNSKTFGTIDNEKDFEPVLNAYFEYNDQNKDKKISKEEFLQANGIIDDKDKQAFYTIFRLADQNNNGFLSKNEFKKYIYSTFAVGLDMDKKICIIYL